MVDSSNVFQEWIEDENWKTLPKGIYRDSVSNADEVTDVDATDIGGQKTKYPALIFDNKGQLTKKDNASVITLKNGRYVNGSKIATSNEAAHTLTVNQYSGKVSVKEKTGS